MGERESNQSRGLQIKRGLQFGELKGNARARGMFKVQKPIID